MQSAYHQCVIWQPVHDEAQSLIPLARHPDPARQAYKHAAGVDTAPNYLSLPHHREP